MKKFSILLSALFLFSVSASFGQKDTTEVKLGKKKLLIIEDQAKKERGIENLENGKQTFEDEIDKTKDESDKLKDMNDELKSQLENAKTDSAKTSISKKIEHNEKNIAENDKKIEAFNKGIDEIDKGIKQMQSEKDSLPKHNGKSWSFEDNPKDMEFKAHWSGFQIGFTNFLNSKYSVATDVEAGVLRLKPESSVGYSLNLFQHSFPLLGSKNAGFATGIGFDWNSFSLADNSDLLVDNQNNLTSVLVPTDVKKYNKNKFNMTYMTVPLLFEYQIPTSKKTFFINFGGTGSVRLWSKQKQKYEQDGSTQKDKNYDSFELSPFRLGATARIGYGPISIYADYSFTPLIKSGHGPELYPFTIGLTLINF
jgi:hypothetical protein